MEYRQRESTAPDGRVGLKVVFNILNRWGCSAEQQQSILQLPKSSYYKYRGAPEAARLTGDQIERISYLLNIHAALRVIFENPENVYGFMRMANNNPPFNGTAPLEMVATGRFGALYEVFRHIDSMRGGMW